MNETKQSRSGILVLHKMLDTLEAIGESRSGLSLADLARATGLPKPTAYRIATTMEARGYLARDSSGHYRMTRKLFDLQPVESQEQRLMRAALPVMEQLVESCRETVNLGVLDAVEVVVISTIESPQAIRMTSKVGNRRHPHSTALGKVLLSGLSEKEVERIIRIRGLPRLMPRTIATREALLVELDRVRKEGFALDDEENEAGGRCVGAPITGRDGRIIAALSISAPIFRLATARVPVLSVELITACRAISRSLVGSAEAVPSKAAKAPKRATQMQASS